MPPVKELCLKKTIPMFLEKPKKEELANMMPIKLFSKTEDKLEFPLLMMLQPFKLPLPTNPSPLKFLLEISTSNYIPEELLTVLAAPLL